MVRWCGGEMVRWWDLSLSSKLMSTSQHINITTSTLQHQHLNTPTYLSLYITPSVAYTGYMVCSMVLNSLRNTPDIPHCTSA